METKKHNLNEEYLNSLTEEQRINEMKEWTAEELAKATIYNLISK